MKAVLGAGIDRNRSVGKRVQYSAIPLNDEARDWLANEGIAAPDSDGRAPTPTELKATLEALDDQSVAYNINTTNWQAQIDDRQSPETGPWTMLNVSNYSDDPDEPCEFYFTKGWPELIVIILFDISKTCGPFLVVPDTGCPPAVVHADTDIEKLLTTWEHLIGG